MMQMKNIKKLVAFLIVLSITYMGLGVSGIILGFLEV
jgi:hypothetical protein